ncbi:hypothetical protein LRS06_10255 [Hymenobacter sp. J193]|uniref:hypothetical protein n=1 Tax=Hymenobacter sp. J193 TaxID=2898429 RepID=UPI0021515EC4|nr:hypothetical protein [Hymenobacter sp. J193]MCR5888145.1 hypothetical protein [Hymenobacter sp. J193]
MGKHKKKHSKKDTVSEDLFEVAALSIRNYRKVTNEIAKLSTGQKLVGGLVLLAAGYFYLDKTKQDDGVNSLLAGLNLPWQPKPTAKATPPPPTAKPAPATASVPAEAPRKSRKAAKTGKAAGEFGKKPAASPDDL